MTNKKTLNEKIKELESEIEERFTPKGRREIELILAGIVAVNGRGKKFQIDVLQKFIRYLPALYGAEMRGKVTTDYARKMNNLDYFLARFVYKENLSDGTGIKVEESDELERFLNNYEVKTVDAYLDARREFLVKRDDTGI